MRRFKLKFEYFELDHMNDDGQISATLKSMTGNDKTPYIFLEGKYFGSAEELIEGVRTGSFLEKIKSIQ